ncbi:hypothetical protein CH373_08085 [Leptospira perolatii]|uniref:Uncharacterized protein n=1 Tax=Leptospira perolatii TaxID=2023191 RepID=A0A2M9ZND7_9LEPT|nr:hypothetical protein [Leptospira perolatii]PJZ68918.1 hypothetical protein CH360_13630 [Leptospira perolatii]PJZ73463.1 hypothetical protein CH373_08085 [Leptospira perolatii]
MRLNWDKIAGVILSTALFYAVGLMVWKNWTAFTNICPITDLLTWDENIRLNVVLDQYQDFKEWKIWRGFLPFLESPTWPPLRSILSLVLLFLPGEWSITWKDSFLGLTFYALCFPTILYTTFKITKSLSFSSLVSLFVLAMTLHTSETPSYSLSSMLETQGMLVLLWVYYSLYKLYSETRTVPAGEELPKGSKSKILVSVSLILLFFTKYPYGLLLFISIFIYECLSRFPEVIGFFRFALRKHYKGIRLVFLFLVVGAVLSLPVLRVLTNWNLDQRSFKKVLYFLTVLLFLDFNYFLYSSRAGVKRYAPPSLRILYIFAILPCFLWLFANPDRVMSLVNAQMIVNEFVTSFILSLFESPTGKLPVSHVFQNPWIFRIFFFGISGIIATWFFFKVSGRSLLWQTESSEFAEASISTKHTPEPSQGWIDSKLAKLESVSWPKVFLDPLFAITAIVFLQYIVIDATTGNKQLRHVFYPLPALLWMLSLWSFRAILGSSQKFKIACLAISIICFGSGLSLFASEGGLLRTSYSQIQYFCLKGFRVDAFQPARDLAGEISEEGKYILLNAFHEDENFQKPGRILASEFDLLFRLKTLEKGKVRNDSKYQWKNWNEFERLLFVGPECSLSEKMTQRIHTMDVSLQEIREIKHPSGLYCMKEFQIRRSVK